MVPATPSPAGPGTPASPPPPVEWRYDATTVGWLRVLRAVAVALLGGVPVAIVGAGAALVGSLLLRGEFGSAALVVLLFSVMLFGRRLSLLLFPSTVEKPGERTPVVSFTYFGGFEGRSGFPRRTAVTLAVLGGGVLAVAGWVALSLTLGLVALGLVAVLLAGTLSTRGTLDPAGPTLANGYVERSLDRLAGYSVRRVGPLVLFRLSYPRAPGSISRPRAFLVPAAHAEAVERGLDHVVTAPVDDTSRRESNPQVRVAAGVLCVVLVVTGVALALLVDGFVAWYLLALLGLFAALLSWVAVVEG